MGLSRKSSYNYNEFRVKITKVFPTIIFIKQKKSYQTTGADLNNPHNGATDTCPERSEQRKV
jgi:hypothetical protein